MGFDTAQHEDSEDSELCGHGPQSQWLRVLQVSSTWAAIRAGLAPHYLLRFASIGLPGGVLMAADAASFDITTAMAGFLGELELALVL